MKLLRTVASWLLWAVCWMGRSLADSFRLDPRALALFRMGLALLLLADLAGRLPDFHAHYTDDGVLPIAAMSENGRFSIHLLSGSAWYQGTLFAVAAGLAVALLLGIRTQVVTVACWFMLLSLHARNPLLLNGGDVLLRLLMFWSMFLPLGACWSLDRAWERGRRPAGPVLSVGSVALVLQVCLMYWTTVVFKDDPAWRSEGTAIYYALNIDGLTTAWGQRLLDFPELMRGMTFVTLWVEVGGPLLLFVPFWRGPLRTLAVFGFIVFHVVALGLSLELILFPYVCAVAWVAFLPAWFWDRLPSWRPAWPTAVLRAVVWGRRRLGAPAPAGVLLPNCLAAFFLLYVVAWNVRSLDYASYRRVFPAQMNRLGNALGLGQKWTMFAPHPGRNSGWYVMRAYLADGRQINLFNDGLPIRWESSDPLRRFTLCWQKPERVSETYKSHRWRKYLSAMNRKDLARYRRYFGEYVHRCWTRHYPDQPPLRKVELYWVYMKTLPDYRSEPPRKSLLYAFDCPGGADRANLENSQAWASGGR